jgi:hypothetical protein
LLGRVDQQIEHAIIPAWSTAGTGGTGGPIIGTSTTGTTETACGFGTYTLQ